MRSRRTTTLAAAMACLALVVAACGSDDSSDTPAEEAEEAVDDAATSVAEAAEDAVDTVESTVEEAADEQESDTTEAMTEDTAGDAGGEASGEPVKVMVISQIEAPDFAFPESASVVEAAAEQLNAAGGINGQPVEILVCNDQRDQNAAAACAREAVSEDVVAVLGIFSLFGDAILPVLEEAGIPYVGNTILSASDSSNPVSFPFDGGVVGGGATVGQQMALAGCEAVGAIGYDNAASTLYMSWVETGATSEGAEWVGDVRVPEGNPDYGPAVASIVSQGADCAFVSLPPAEAAKLLGAVAQSGEDLRVGTGVSTMPPQVIAAVPAEATEGAILTSANPTTQDTDFPGVQEYIDAMTEAGVPEDQINGSYGLLSYARAQVLFNALAAIDGEITAETAIEALSNITDPGTPLYGTFSTTEEFPQEGFNRLFNFTALVYTAEGQQLVLVSDDFVDVTELVNSSAQ